MIQTSHARQEKDGKYRGSSTGTSSTIEKHGKWTDCTSSLIPGLLEKRVAFRGACHQHPRRLKGQHGGTGTRVQTMNVSPSAPRSSRETPTLEDR